MSQIVVCDCLAEMRLPGRAWLEFEVQPTTSGSQIRQTAMFDPVGLAGLAYWYLVYPLHQIVFAGMLRGIVRAGREFVDANVEPWRPSRARQTVWLLGLVAICFAAAAAGGAVTSSLSRRLVSNAQETELDTTGLAFRSRLDSAVFPDGSLGVARVATRRLARLTSITRTLWAATRAQRGLVGHFFRNA